MISFPISVVAVTIVSRPREACFQSLYGAEGVRNDARKHTATAVERNIRRLVSRCRRRLLLYTLACCDGVSHLPVYCFGRPERPGARRGPGPLGGVVRRSRSQWEEARLPRLGDEVISRQSSTPVLLLIDSTCWQNVLTNVLSKTIIKKVRLTITYCT